MLHLLFWNLNKNARATRPLLSLVREYAVDVVVLAEAPTPIEALGTQLQGLLAGGLTLARNRVNTRVTSFSRAAAGLGDLLGESRYMTVRPVRRADGLEWLLAAYHGISRLEDEQVDLDEEACIAATLLREVEAARGHRRTLLVGDMNLNPFDPGMAKARGFFGVMAKADAARDTQRLKFNDYPLFYNPMWSRLGDGSPGPPGTYYRERSSHLAYYWHTYDQVLLRPDLLPAYDASRLHVPTRAGKIRLLGDGVINTRRASDHLPIVIGLDIDQL